MIDQKKRAATHRRCAPQTELHQLMRRFFASGLGKEDLLSLLGNEILFVVDDELRQFEPHADKDAL